MRRRRSGIGHSPASGRCFSSISLMLSCRSRDWRANMADNPSVFGKSLASENLADYESPEEYSGDTRTIKHLLFPWLVETESPMFPGETILTERTAKQGEEVSVEELGPLALEKGERLGSFYTDEELK